MVFIEQWSRKCDSATDKLYFGPVDMEKESWRKKKIIKQTTQCCFVHDVKNVK